MQTYAGMLGRGGSLLYQLLYIACDSRVPLWLLVLLYGVNAIQHGRIAIFWRRRANEQCAGCMRPGRLQ